MILNCRLPSFLLFIHILRGKLFACKLFQPLTHILLSQCRWYWPPLRWLLLVTSLRWSLRWRSHLQEISRCSPSSTASVVTLSFSDKNYLISVPLKFCNISELLESHHVWSNTVVWIWSDMFLALKLPLLSGVWSLLLSVTLNNNQLKMMLCNVGCFIHYKVYRENVYMYSPRH